MKYVISLTFSCREKKKNLQLSPYEVFSNFPTYTLFCRDLTHNCFCTTIWNLELIQDFKFVVLSRLIFFAMHERYLWHIKKYIPLNNTKGRSFLKCFRSFIVQQYLTIYKSLKLPNSITEQPWKLIKTLTLYFQTYYSCILEYI